MNGEWIWILLALFGIFRLLALAGKKKAGAPPPVSPGPGRAEPASPLEEVDELKLFIDSLTGRADPVRPPGRPPAPPRPRPPSPGRPARPLTPGPPPAFAPAVGAAVTAVPDGPVPGLFSASLHPVVRGIIFSEILGPPRGLGGEPKLPGDL